MNDRDQHITDVLVAMDGFDYNGLIRVSRSCDMRGRRRFASVQIRCANGDVFSISATPLKTCIERHVGKNDWKVIYESKGKR